MIEEKILSALVFSEDYSRKVFPYIKEEYFDTPSEKTLFKAYSEIFSKYNKIPTKEVLALKVDSMPDLNEVVFEETSKLIEKLSFDENSPVEFLVDETETFCRDRAIYNAIKSSIVIIDGKDKKLGVGAIPKMLEEALAVSFVSSIGHDFFEDSDERWEYYQKSETRIPFDIDILNKITQGGLPPGSLTILAAMTGGGKSIVKCHMAANNLMQGKNVLYITLELSEKEISRRIEANQFDINISDIKDLTKEAYDRKLAKLREKTTGKLVVQEYPTGSASTTQFRHLLSELKQKKNFVPDVIYVDYLNICSSARIKDSDNSYGLLKAVAEELRGIAMEYQIPVVTSTQVNRGGYNNTDIDLTNMSESMGPSHTADFMLAIINTEELDERGQFMFKQLKNRWGDLGRHRRFVVGINKAKMKLINIDTNNQPDLTDSMPTPKDNTIKQIARDSAEEPKRKAKTIDKEKSKKLVFT